MQYLLWALYAGICLDLTPKLCEEKNSITLDQSIYEDALLEVKLEYLTVLSSDNLKKYYWVFNAFIKNKSFNSTEYSNQDLLFYVDGKKKFVQPATNLIAMTIVKKITIDPGKKVKAKYFLETDSSNSRIIFKGILKNEKK